MSEPLNTSAPARFSVLIIVVFIIALLTGVKYLPSWMNLDQPIRVIETKTPFGVGLTEPETSDIASGSSVTAQATSSSALANTETAKVVRVIDGDTIEIEGGQKVRYIGIDTPETKDPRRPVGCYGQEASDKNKQLVEGKTVEMEKDVSQTDKYGRLLRYVFVDGQMVNRILVEQGFAKASTYPPDVKYQALFQQAETTARQSELGLWGESCKI